jgi:hypothetical protein
MQSLLAAVVTGHSLQVAVLVVLRGVGLLHKILALLVLVVPLVATHDLELLLQVVGVVVRAHKQSQLVEPLEVILLQPQLLLVRRIIGEFQVGLLE